MLFASPDSSAETCLVFCRNFPCLAVSILHLCCSMPLFCPEVVDKSICTHHGICNKKYFCHDFSFPFETVVCSFQFQNKLWSCSVPLLRKPFWRNLQLQPIALFCLSIASDVELEVSGVLLPFWLYQSSQSGGRTNQVSPEDSVSVFLYLQLEGMKLDNSCCEAEPEKACAARGSAVEAAKLSSLHMVRIFASHPHCVLKHEGPFPSALKKWNTPHLTRWGCIGCCRWVSITVKWKMEVDPRLQTVSAHRQLQLLPLVINVHFWIQVSDVVQVSATTSLFHLISEFCRGFREIDLPLAACGRWHDNKI